MKSYKYAFKVHTLDEAFGKFYKYLRLNNYWGMKDEDSAELKDWFLDNAAEVEDGVYTDYAIECAIREYFEIQKEVDDDLAAEKEG
jgi:hypothetical protein